MTDDKYHPFPRNKKEEQIYFMAQELGYKVKIINHEVISIRPMNNYDYFLGENAWDKLYTFLLIKEKEKVNG